MVIASIEKRRVVMLPIAQVVTLLLIAIAMACSMAHALEYPGKLRLPKETYFEVQGIYYPGFTFVGGLAEIAGLLGALALVFATPRGAGAAFVLTLAAFVSMLLVHAVFWIVTQPVNRVWVRKLNLNGAATRFFRSDTNTDAVDRNWSSLRDRWEYSHIARALLSTIALATLAAGMTAT
jgi:hypothetical protein